MKIETESKLGVDYMKSIQLYYTDINQELSPSEYEQCIHLITPENASLIKRFRFVEDRKRTLYGEVMARCLFMELLAVKNKDLVIEKNPYGKPYFAGIHMLHYNISHSGRFVLCGISNQELGVDIEEIKELHMDIAKRCFTKQEYESMLNVNENEVKKLFYTYWTLKESYIKYDGRGLSIALDSFSISRQADSFVVDSKKYTESIQLYTKFLELNYIVAVAYGGEKKKVELIYRDLREFLD